MADTPRRIPGSTDMRAGTADSDVNPLIDTTDWPRIQAIALGAIVALVNGPCRVAGDMDVSLAELNERAA